MPPTNHDTTHRTISPSTEFTQLDSILLSSSQQISKGNSIRTSPLPPSPPISIPFLKSSPSFLLISLVPGYRSPKVRSELHVRIDPEKTSAYYDWGVGKIGMEVTFPHMYVSIPTTKIREKR